MAKYVITGGAGFVGSQLGYKLHQEGHDVLLIDDMSYGRLDNLTVDGEFFGEFRCVDIRSKEMYQVLEGVHYVYHFAGIAPLPDCQIDPMEAISVNVAGTANILDAARVNGVKRVVFSSTSAVYEDNESFPAKEQDGISPYLVYATSKQQAELSCESFRRTYGLDVVRLRFFNVYGPHQDFRRKHPPLIGYIIRELFRGKSPKLHSNGEQRRDYVYVEDVISLCQAAAGDSVISGSVLNVATGETVSVKEIFEIIAETMASDIKANYAKEEDFWKNYPGLYEGALTISPEILGKEVNKYAVGDNSAARAIGWSPNVSIVEGLQKSVRYAVSLMEKIE